MNHPNLAKLGDSIQTTVRQPMPRVITMILITPMACAYGNSLLLNPTSGWSLTKTTKGNEK